MPNADAWIERDGPNFRVRYRGLPLDPKTGNKTKRNWGTYDTPGKADKALKQCVEKIERLHFDECDTDLPSAQAFELWKQAARAGTSNKKRKKLKEKTIECYRASLKWLIDNAPTVADLHDRKIEEWVAVMGSKGYTGWTICRRLTDAKSWLRWCKRRKLITWDPFSEIPVRAPRGKPEPYSEDEIYSIEQATEGNPRMKLATRLGYLAGMRSGEVLAFDIKYVHRLGNGSGLYQLDNNKSDEDQAVVLPPEVMELIGSATEGRPFAGWTHKILQYHWTKIKRKAKISDRYSYYDGRASWGLKKETASTDWARFHRLRHTFACRWLKGGGDLQSCKQAMRHADIATTSRFYSRWETKRLVELSAIVARVPTKSAPGVIIEPEQKNAAGQ